MSATLSTIVLIVILAVALGLAIIVFVKVQRREWFSGLRLDGRDKPGSSPERRK